MLYITQVPQIHLKTQQPSPLCVHDSEHIPALDLRTEWEFTVYQLQYWALQGKFLMLHPPALGMEEEGDLCKRHIRWTPFREKHFKVFSLPTVKNMGLEPGERQAVLSPLLCPSGKQDLGYAPVGLTKGTWCNLGQSPGLNFPEWVSSCKYLSFLGSWPAAAWEEKGKLLGTLSVNTQWHQNLALEVSWSPPVLSTQDFS